MNESKRVDRIVKLVQLANIFSPVFFLCLYGLYFLHLSFSSGHLLHLHHPCSFFTNAVGFESFSNTFESPVYLSTYLMIYCQDQYMGRSEMWRLKKSLVDSVVFINKKITFCKVNRSSLYYRFRVSQEGRFS